MSKIAKEEKELISLRKELGSIQYTMCTTLTEASRLREEMNNIEKQYTEKIESLMNESHYNELNSKVLELKAKIQEIENAALVDFAFEVIKSIKTLKDRNLFGSIELLEEILKEGYLHSYVQDYALGELIKNGFFKNCESQGRDEAIDEWFSEESPYGGHRVCSRVLHSVMEFPALVVENPLDIKALHTLKKNILNFTEDEIMQQETDPEYIEYIRLKKKFEKKGAD